MCFGVVTTVCKGLLQKVSQVSRDKGEETIVFYRHLGSQEEDTAYCPILTWGITTEKRGQAEGGANI